MTSWGTQFHTNDFKEKARKALGVPDYPQVDAIYGAPWYWEGAFNPHIILS